MNSQQSRLARLLCAAFLLLVTLRAAYSGDDASGRTPCSVDLSRPFTAYSMTTGDRLWSEALAKRLRYAGRVVHLVRTSLPVEGWQYLPRGRCLPSGRKARVLNTDAMLKIGSQWAYSPGVGGFSMQAPKSRNFIVCLNFVGGGVPFLSSSRYGKAWSLGTGMTTGTGCNRVASVEDFMRDVLVVDRRAFNL